MTTRPPTAMRAPLVQVKSRPTPVKDGNRRQTFSSFDDLGRDELPPQLRAPGAMPPPPSAARVPNRSRDDIDIVRLNGTGGAGRGGVGDSATGMFSPGVGPVELGTGKRRRGN